MTPTATDAALPLSTLGGACGAGVASCLHGCCSQVGVCDTSAAACGAMCQVLFSLRVFCFCFFLWKKRRVSSCFSLGAHPHFSFITSTHETNTHGNAHVGQVLVATLAVPRQEPAAPEPGRAAARPRGRCLRRVRRPVRERLLQPAQLLRGRNGRGDGGGVVRVLAVELLARGQPQLDRVQGRESFFCFVCFPFKTSLDLSHDLFLIFLLLQNRFTRAPSPSRGDSSLSPPGGRRVVSVSLLFQGRKKLSLYVFSSSNDQQ